MSKETLLFRYTLRLADNVLILAQRMIELVTAEPELEQELANANFALDYLGQARMLYAYAAELADDGRSEDDLAYLRDGHEFENLLLLEQPNGHFGDAIVKQFLFEAFYLHLLVALAKSSDSRLAEIAVKAEKEVRYHCSHSAQWLIRLGDGTDLSHERAQGALQNAWRFTGEMFAADDVDREFQTAFGGPDLDEISRQWRADVAPTVAEATLQLPADEWMHEGGKQGRHSEHLGYLLAEMQYLQRSFPGATW